MRLTAADFKGKFLEVQPQKTKHSSGVKVVIPVHSDIRQVLSLRGVPKKISASYFNIFIKKTAKTAGINEPIEGELRTTRKQKGIYAKWQLISSHTCRRTFATNLYKSGFPSISIMKITGHTTEKSFLSYIKVTPTEHAEKLQQHWEMLYK